MSSSLSVLERVIQSRQKSLSVEVAQFILSLAFSSEDQQRSEYLSNKSQAGTLSESEEAELDELVTTNDLLTILKSQARLSLKKTPLPPAA